MEKIRQMIIDKANKLWEQAEEMEKIADMVKTGITEKDNLRYIRTAEHYMGVAAGLRKASNSVLKMKKELEK